MKCCRLWLNFSHLDDVVCMRLRAGSCPDAKDGVGDGHAVFSTDGVEQSHGDAEEGHAEHAAASPPPQTPQQADSVHRCPGYLQRQNERFVLHVRAAVSHLDSVFYFEAVGQLIKDGVRVRHISYSVSGEFSELSLQQLMRTHRAQRPASCNGSVSAV